MKIMRGSYFFLLILIGVSAGYAVTSFSKNSSMPDSSLSFFAIDPRFSESEQQAIALALEQERLKAPHLLASSVQEKFPAISYVSVFYSARADQEIEVRSVNPLVCVNDAHVLCDQGPLLPSSLYNPQLLTTLERLTVKTMPDTPQAVEQLRNFVTHMPHTHFERFAIDWRTETQTVFHDKEKKDFCMIADGTRIPSAEMIKRCDAIYALMKEQTKKEAAKKNNTASIITDIRFDKQIIAYFKRGEGEV